MIEPSLVFLRKSCKEFVITINNNLVQSLMRILNCFFVDYKESESRKITPEDIDSLESMLGPLFIFSLIWSIGCTCNYESRLKFDIFIRETLIPKFEIKVNFPKDDDLIIYDYFFNLSKKNFEGWDNLIKKVEIDSSLSYNEIMIPTRDSTRNLYLMKMLIKNNYHVLTVGPTGTGKSQNAMTLLTSNLGDQYQYISLAFSAQTSANQTQDTIDSKLDKRRKGYYGPPFGKKCVIFVDDLNMPKKEIFNAQPPIEILRQFCDYKVYIKNEKLYLI